MHIAYEFITIKRITYFPLLSVLFLTACSTFFTKEKSSDSLYWQHYQQEVRGLNHYKAYGTITYISNYKKKYVRFLWQKTGYGYYQLFLINLLGNIELKAIIQPNSLKLIDSQGHFFTTNDPEKVIKRFFNIPISLNNFQQWILGLPGESINYKFDNQCRLNEINYIDSNQTWKVIYYGYNTKIQPSLPSSIKIKLEKGDQSIKLKIDTWTIG